MMIDQVVTNETCPLPFHSAPIPLVPHSGQKPASTASAKLHGHCGGKAFFAHVRLDRRLAAGVSIGGGCHLVDDGCEARVVAEEVGDFVARVGDREPPGISAT